MARILGVQAPILARSFLSWDADASPKTAATHDRDRCAKIIN